MTPAARDTIGVARDSANAADASSGALADAAGDASADAASDAALAASIELAAARLVVGRLVAFPTETVYGLGADAGDDAAVARIFAAKGRPRGHPLIVHLPVGGDLARWASAVPPAAAALVERFWPGPLTLVLPRRDDVGAAAAGGQPSIGLRCPAHPVARALLSRCVETRGDGAIGIAAPSANRFGHVSPTRAVHVLDEFPDARVDDPDAAIFVIDGGDCPIGIESTIVDCTRLDRLGPVVLRPGSISAAMIAEVIGAMPAITAREGAGHDEAPGRSPDAPRASGTLDVHYAPSTPLALVDAAALANAPHDVAVWTHSTSYAALRDRWLKAPADATAYAFALYATLRRLDASGARAIWVERPPTGPAWDAVADRLRRAAASARD